MSAFDDLDLLSNRANPNLEYMTILVKWQEKRNSIRQDLNESEESRSWSSSSALWADFRGRRNPFLRDLIQECSNARPEKRDDLRKLSYDSSGPNRFVLEARLFPYPRCLDFGLWTLRPTLSSAENVLGTVDT